MSIFAHMRARAASLASAPVLNGPCQTMVSRIGLFQLARPFSVSYSASNTNHIVRSRRKSPEPILDTQPRHAAEFANVVGHHDQAKGHGLRGDELVHGSDPRAGPLELQTQTRIGWNAHPVERQDR